MEHHGYTLPFLQRVFSRGLCSPLHWEEKVNVLEPETCKTCNREKLPLLNHQIWLEVLPVAALSSSRHVVPTFQPTSGVQPVRVKEPEDWVRHLQFWPHVKILRARGVFTNSGCSGCFPQKSSFSGSGLGPGEWLRCPARVRKRQSRLVLKHHQGAEWPLANYFTSSDFSFLISKVRTWIGGIQTGHKSASPRKP